MKLISLCKVLLVLLLCSSFAQANMQSIPKIEGSKENKPIYYLMKTKQNQDIGVGVRKVRTKDKLYRYELIFINKLGKDEKIFAHNKAMFTIDKERYERILNIEILMNNEGIKETAIVQVSEILIKKIIESDNAMVNICGKDIIFNDNFKNILEKIRREPK